MAFGALAVVAAAPVDVRSASALLPAAVDLDVRRLRLDERRVDHVRDGDRVVERRAVQVGVGAAVPAAVEVEQLGRDLADAAHVAQRLGVGVGHECLVGDVEADHRHVDPALEDAPGRLGVGPDVELGGRRAVALTDRAAHQHDPLRAGVGLQREQERDVRQRPGRDQREPPVALPDLPREERRPRARRRPPAGGGRSGPSRPVSPWTCAATSRVADEGLRRARGDRDIAAARRARARASAFAVVFSSVWLPATVVTPSSSTSGEATASISAIASSWPGSQSMRIGVPGLMRPSASPRRPAASGSERWAPSSRLRTRRPCRHAAAPPRSGRSSSSADDEAGGERVAGAGAVHRDDPRRRRARHLPAVLEQRRALRAVGDGDELSALHELVLDRLTMRRSGSRSSTRAGDALSAKNVGLRSGGDHDLVGHLELASAPPPRPREASPRRLRPGRRRFRSRPAGPRR